MEGEDPADKIITALKTAKPTLRRAALVRAITTAVERDRSLVDQVLRIFFNVLKTLRAKGDLEETIQALYQAAIGQATGDADKLKGFQHRVKELASIPSLVITAKALGVLAANANTFCRARTVSEEGPSSQKTPSVRRQPSSSISSASLFTQARSWKKTSFLLQWTPTTWKT